MSSPLHRLVALVVLLGACAQLAVGALLHGERAVAPLDAGSSWLLLLVLFVLTFASDWVTVYVRRGSEVEGLTLFEVAVVADVLLLPTSQALLVPVAATALCSIARRRGLLKTAFNAGNLAAAVAVPVLTVHLLADPGDGLSGPALAGLVVGMLGLTVINLVSVALLLAVANGEQPWPVIRDGLALSVAMALGTAALGTTAVTMAWAAPLLLPATLMPAAALTFAYRAAAQEAEERERSTRLLALSQVLAGRLDPDQVLNAFLELTRQAFGADVALALLDGEAHPTAVLSQTGQQVVHRAATPEEVWLLDRVGLTGAAALQDELPDGWTHALAAPLEAEGRRLGAVVLATGDRRRQLGPRELTLLTPTASALAVALRGAAHLRRLEEETSKLQAVVDHSSDGILVLDGQGLVQLWSPAVEDLTGLPAAAAQGRPLREVVAALGPDGTPCNPFLVGRAQLSSQTPQATVEITVLRHDGEQRVVRCAHAAVFDEDGGLQRDVVMLHDVTRERQVERLKADFIATVSHELRTPVTPIKGYADLLRRRGDVMTPEKRHECLDIIADRAGHLARLVEDLLLASRISATEGSAPAQVDMGLGELGALVRRACGDFDTDSERVMLDLPEREVPVGCDRVRTIQVLTNLVGNALKYSTPGSEVQVRLRVADGRAVVEVEDRGRGIPADQLERVFEKFHRVEDPMRMTTSGTGLGLYIARQLATAMGGELRCTSVLGHGSVFTFTLPLASADLVGSGERPATSRPVSVRPDVVPGQPLRGRHTPPWALPPRPAGAPNPAPALGTPQPLG